MLANIFTFGTAASLLNGKNVKRTRYAYHLTLAWLHILECCAYADYINMLGPCDTAESIDAWEERQCKQSRTFSFWTTVKNFLLLVCRFVRAQRQCNWDLTLKACWSLPVKSGTTLVGHLSLYATWSDYQSRTQMYTLPSPRAFLFCREAPQNSH